MTKGMTATLVTFDESPNEVDAGIHHVEEEVLGVLREAAGLTGVWLVDRERGRRISLMVWDSADHADAAFAALAEHRERLGNPPRPTPSSVENYEVYGLIKS
jgi:hypothetical protein